ncbi:TIGR02646 family protein [Pseudoalteromonas sp. SR43-7]|uniref:retron system putative HNH endonuclease n=1 Tax=unclassified Pseudoalteromonas TaxID=194690 RepID=UPI00023161A7|nr:MULTISPECIES: retron system putative HNH endonuclease [unclassified Pseudoalteromonas]MBB1329604.1 TIGR02646 family protein [Pseudoalteromonas sp. SR43-7]GAA81348.1 hypothetical protein P20495_3878 [Pseudoalteromonas sp. BSi20495]
MRRIKKGVANRHLESRHMEPPQTHEQATKAWDRFQGERKRATKNLCYEEQFGLCGYSEISLDNIFPIIDDSNYEISRNLGIHIEHVEPKNINPQRTFDHTNLIASAIKDIKANNLIKKDVFGGHAKLKWFNEISFISPLLENCCDYFHYETTGKVVPKESLPTRREKAKARLTIHKLNLNAPILVNWRNVWLKALEEIIDESDEASLSLIAETELLPINGLLRPFHSAQRGLFGKIGERICHDNGL